MEIDFVGPAVPAEDGGISFRAMVDGQPVACKFSMEALQDVNPNLTMAAPIEQFEARRSALLAVAEKKIRTGKVANGVVTVFTQDL